MPEFETSKGLCYCTICRTVKFEAILLSKDEMQKHEVANPNDGFYAFCFTCSPNKLFAGLLEVLTDGKVIASTVHRPLKASLHIPEDLNEDQKNRMTVEVEERVKPAPDAPKGSHEGESSVE